MPLPGQFVARGVVDAEDHPRLARVVVGVERELLDRALGSRSRVTSTIQAS